MNNKKYFLTSGRLGFGHWSNEDFELAYKLWGNFEVTKFIDARGRLSEEQIQERLNKEIETNNKYGIQYWPMFLLSSDEFIGCCGLRPYDLPKYIYEAGVHILPDFWGNGFATEAIQTVMKYGFTILNAKALFAGHNPKNETSRCLLLKSGFSYTHNEFYPPTGLHHPSYLITLDEYNRDANREKRTGTRVARK